MFWSPLGRVVLSKLWVFHMPNVRLRSPLGKVVLCKLLVKQFPNVRFWSPLGRFGKLTRPVSKVLLYKPWLKS